MIVFDDMNLTVAQIIDERGGREFANWPNAKNLPSVKAYIPYAFGQSLDSNQRAVITKIADRFNKDLTGCVMIR